MSGNKDATEKPTPKRLKEARSEGQTARTQDLGAWASVLVATWVIPMTLTDLFDSSSGVLHKIAKFIAAPDQADALRLLGEAFQGGALAVAPLLGATLLAVLAAAGAQGGLRPAMKLLKPKFSKLNPLKGIKRMFGPQSLWELVKTLLKTGILAAVLYTAVKDLVPVIMGSGSLPLQSLVDTLGSTVLKLLRLAAAAGLVMAVADYIVAKRRVGKELRMTKQQVKDEHKNVEGDPQIKGQIRARQMAMSRNRMMADIATADVVMANPTHVAVALRYDPARGAPRVVAKGAGVIAAKIREKATEHRVPIVRDVPLARALYAGCEVGQEIPVDLFAPVAHVLAFLHRLRSRGSAAGTHTMPESAKAAA
ncbi:EscU/YscU/HrcU family type III secretion system export apparatus switch protein [Actinokineospora auranticolor]|uniref:Flagellar biosynthetic protein FlhB n=1 Tax=Actinokineospora auranticolor TaxID=155976 RepID=A0A2S6GMV5_9PSEU|nr:EscU/YscU/HrcU family type III secretion system export apparatus switch protein [Actinokineospora auranticolor]PPK66496.1 flagellar biosynthetic protein FlhB [Actinokineospora auranticolor]